MSKTTPTHAVLYITQDHTTTCRLQYRTKDHLNTCSAVHGTPLPPAVLYSTCDHITTCSSVHCTVHRTTPHTTTCSSVHCTVHRTTPHTTTCRRFVQSNIYITVETEMTEVPKSPHLFEVVPPAQVVRPGEGGAGGGQPVVRLLPDPVLDTWYRVSSSFRCCSGRPFISIFCRKDFEF